VTADEAKAIIDRFAAADSSLVAIAAVTKQLIDQVAADGQALSAADRRELEEWRAKGEVDRLNTNERQQRCRDRKKSRDGHVTSRDGPAASHAHARSSSIFLEERKTGGDDTRARANEKISLDLARPPIDPDDLTTQIEAIVKEHGRWPPRQTEGWNHAVNVSIVDRLLREGVAANTILDAVRIATARSPYQHINGFNFFSGPIARAHTKARAQLQLPLNNSNNVKVVGGRKDDYAKRRIAAAKQAEASDRERSSGDGAPVDQSVDTAGSG
jgi:hypothetical protein